MNEHFSQLVQRFYAIKDTNSQRRNALIADLRTFIENHKETNSDINKEMLAKAYEFQLSLYVLNAQIDKAQAIERILDDQFESIHRIGKKIATHSKNNYEVGGLNLPAHYADITRIKRLSISQSKGIKPRLLGWAITGIGLILLALSIWLFSKKWIWIPVIIGFMGVLFTTIGARVRIVINQFLSTIAFNNGILIPGIITAIHKKECYAIFMVPLMTNDEQPPRWLIKQIPIKQEGAYFCEGDRVAGLCLLNNEKNSYYQNASIMPVYAAVASSLIHYKAITVIKEHYWQQLSTLIKQYDKAVGVKEVVVDDQLQKIS